jgi:hypothetical protein
MSARRQIIAALSEDSLGGIATLHDVAHAEQLVDAYKAEMLAEAADYFEQRRPSRADAVSDFDRGRRATVGWVVEELRDQAGAGAGEKASAQAPTATPTDTNRRARLLHEMDLGGRWKSGDVVAWYQRNGLTGLDVRAARHDLATLRDSGAITQHDTAGVRFYTRAAHTTRKDGRS